MKARHLLPILLMLMLTSCTAFTYLPHLPAEPMYTGKEKAQAQVMVGPRHSELQLSGAIKHIGASANLYYGYTIVSSYSQEYSLHTYTSFSKKFYGSLTGGYSMARVGTDKPAINTVTTFRGTSQYHGFHVQPCFYFVNTSKKRKTPFEFKMGLGVKISGLEYSDLTYFRQTTYMGGTVAAEEDAALIQPVVFYFYTPYFIFQRTRPSGLFFKAYLGVNFVGKQGENSTYHEWSVGTFPVNRKIAQYPEHLPLLIAASLGFTLR